MECPWLLNDERIASLFPADAIERARSYTSQMSSVGAYSPSKGYGFVREAISKFIAKRDNVASVDPESIFVTCGASDAISRVLRVLISDHQVGVLIPIPQYPLYHATITLCNGHPIPYHLNESNGWSLDIDSIKKALHGAREKGINVRALCIINPGNPTGSNLDRSLLVETVKLCAQEGLVLLSDEVYQSNVYHDAQFCSAFKAVQEAQVPLELFSFHSVSKGLVGECGRRGGYMHCHGIDPSVMEQFYKLASITLCAPIGGQLMLALQSDPPTGESAELYHRELSDLKASLTRRAKLLEQCFNQMDDVTCQPAVGAMYLFPRIRFPPNFITFALEQHKAPDTLYSLMLLSETGVCMVPGSGFGQEKGTYHVRTTFLPSEELFAEFTRLIQTFHTNFMSRFK